MKGPTPKRRTREHIIADLGVNHVERQVLLAGYTPERLRFDYGTDLLIRTFTEIGEVEEGKIAVQIKATDSVRISGAGVTWRLERAHLVSWLHQPMPVILIAYDAKKDVAYWLYVQSHFQRLADFDLFSAGKTVSVMIPITNILDSNAVRKFAEFRDRVFEQIGEISHEED